MKKNRASFINIVFSSIVMVFIMICLVTFASLSVLTAYSDYRLSTKVADKTTAYYQADALAREMTAHIDTKLYSIYETSATSAVFFEKITTFDFSESKPDGIYNILSETTDDSAVISYVVPVSDIQNLYVTLKVNYPDVGSECFTTITRWQTVTENTPDESEDFLNLYTGNE